LEINNLKVVPTEPELYLADLEVGEAFEWKAETGPAQSEVRSGGVPCMKIRTATSADKNWAWVDLRRGVVYTRRATTPQQVRRINVKVVYYAA
jgi:hypothetical protein